MVLVSEMGQGKSRFGKYSVPYWYPTSTDRLRCQTNYVEAILFEANTDGQEQVRKTATQWKR